MTIYEIKRLTEESAPHFFTRSNLRFAGQTLRDFSVKKQADGRFLISAPLRDRFTRKQLGYTKRYFNPLTNKLEHN